MRLPTWLKLALTYNAGPARHFRYPYLILMLNRFITHLIHNNNNNNSHWGSVSLYCLDHWSHPADQKA